MLSYECLGCVPCDEGCEAVGTKGYDRINALNEARRYRDQLRKMFPKGTFEVKEFSHDFGMYFEVVIKYDDQNFEQAAYAYFVEDNLPEKWDDNPKEVPYCAKAYSERTRYIRC